MRGRTLTTVLTLSVLLAWAQGVVLQRYVLGSHDLDQRDTLLTGAGVGLAVAGLLFVTMVVTLRRHRPWRLLVLMALGVGTQLALALAAVGRARFSDHADGPVTGLGHGVVAGVAYPGSWPLVVVLVVMLVLPLTPRLTGRSRPERPAPPGR